ncbi:MAG: site-specific integrase [Thermomicrobiales bacterium]
MSERASNKHRSHGEGSVYQRASDGRWIGAIMVDGRRKTVSGKTRAEANRKLTRIKADLDRGLPMVTGGKTVSTFLDEWLEQIVKPTTRPRTYDNYRYVSDFHLKPTIGKHRLEKLSQQQVQAMLNAKLTSDLAPASVANIRRVLRVALNQAMRWDLVARNVVTLTTLPKSEAYEGYALDADEVGSLLTAAHGERLEALYWVAISLGLRQAELFGLRWSDVDLEEGVLHVRKQLQYRRVTDVPAADGEAMPAVGRKRWEEARAAWKASTAGGKSKEPRVAVLVTPKTATSRRTISIPSRVIEALRRHQERQQEHRLEAGGRWQEWDLVFTTSIGTPLNQSNFRKGWLDVRKRAGLPDDMRFHDLRHSALSLMADRDVPVHDLKAIAGHAQVTTTMQLYVHSSAAKRKAAAASLDDLFPVDKRST